MAASTFTNTAGGTWDVPGNWSTNSVPSTTLDSAFITTPGTYTVTLDSVVQPDSITLNDPNATLSITTAGEMLANTIALDAGTLALAGEIIGSTITAAGALFEPVGSETGTLDGVTWLGQLVGGGTTAAYTVNIVGGITVLNGAGTAPGTLEFGSLYTVNIEDAETLDNMVIQFDSLNAEYLRGPGSLALTLGSHALLVNSAAGNDSPQITGQELINFGTIDGSASGGVIDIFSSTFDNQGTVIVTNHDTITAASDFINGAGGVITVSAGGTLVIGATGTPMNNSSIAVSLGGTLDATANLAGTGQITLSGHSVVEVHNVGGSILFLDKTGTVDLQAAGGFTGAIEGFQKGDTIDLIGVASTNPPVYDAGTGTLTINNGASAVAMLDVGTGYGSETFSLGPDGGSGTDVTVACFAEGTRILTTAGEVAVESLQVGDLLPALSGRASRVRWLGHRRIDCRRHPRPTDIWPVRIQAGALADAVPHRDLWLSPDHALLVDGVLVPVRHLVNGSSIAQLETPEVSYWHVELDRHDVLLAEGLAAESFLDTGNRDAFANGGAVVQAHPDFAFAVWEARSCAPLTVAGPVLAAAKARLRARAEALGCCLAAGPDLQLATR